MSRYLQILVISKNSNDSKIVTINWRKLSEFKEIIMQLEKYSEEEMEGIIGNGMMRNVQTRKMKYYTVAEINHLHLHSVKTMVITFPWFSFVSYELYQIL